MTPTCREDAEHMARLGDVGARVARVAHELKVPVSVISGSLENLEQYVGALVQYARRADVHRPHDDELAGLYRELDLAYVLDNVTSLLQLCRTGSTQLNHMVRELKGYTHQAAVPLLDAPVDLAKVLAEAVALVTASRATTPVVHWHVQRPLIVCGAAESLTQAFVNVLANAYDAVQAGVDPQVWIASEHIPGIDAQDVAAITIRDNGPGIPAAYAQRIFEAFFTTKSQGAGLGLGLPITKDIIEAHGGSIALEPSAQPGVAFVIRLPARKRP